jgi:hypothetical protein
MPSDGVALLNDKDELFTLTRNPPKIVFSEFVPPRTHFTLEQIPLLGQLVPHIVFHGPISLVLTLSITILKIASTKRWQQVYHL